MSVQSKLCLCNSTQFAPSRHEVLHIPGQKTVPGRWIYRQKQDISCMCGWKPTPKLVNVTRCKWRMREGLVRHVAEASCKDAPPCGDQDRGRYFAGLVPICANETQRETGKKEDTHRQQDRNGKQDAKTTGILGQKGICGCV